MQKLVGGVCVRHLFKASLFLLVWYWVGPVWKCQDVTVEVLQLVCSCAKTAEASLLLLHSVLSRALSSALFGRLPQYPHAWQSQPYLGPSFSVGLLAFYPTNAPSSVQLPL